MLVEFLNRKSCAAYVCQSCKKTTCDYGELWSDRDIRNIIETYCEHCATHHVARYLREGEWVIAMTLGI